ncbi:MAG: hypothetical protein ACKN9U_19410, partial [Pirellulaceae bacterium]
RDLLSGGMWGFLFLFDRSIPPVLGNPPIFLIFPGHSQGKVRRSKSPFFEKQGVQHDSLGKLNFVEKKWLSGISLRRLYRSSRV